MWRVISLIWFLGSKSQKILEYRPGVNYGQVFRDYTNNGWHAVSGTSSAVDIYDVYPTDRGSFVDGSDFRQITLPSNDVSTGYFSLPSSFMVAVWLMVNRDDGGLIFVRFKENDQTNNFFYLRRLKADSNLSFKYVVNGVIVGNVDGPISSFTKFKWCFIVLSVSTTTFKAYQNEVLYSTLTFSTPYQEIGNYNMQIGGKFNAGGCRFLLWSFTIDSSSDQSGYMSKVLTNNCLVSPCNPCNPEIVFGSTSGCLSEVTDETSNSNKDICNSNLYGCTYSPLVLLNCGCSFQSCTLNGTSHLCVCPSSAVSTTTTCVCPTGQTIRWDLCCESSCLTCSSTNPDICLTCVASNAVPHTVGCKCQDMFFNTTSLVTSTSCISCHNNCKTCSSSLLCTTCIDSNAEIHSTVGCICKLKFYNTTSLSVDGNCKPCHSDCETCTSSFLCTSCIDSNAQVHSTVGCTCKVGFYNITSLSLDGNCKVCHNNCKTCTSSLLCTSCLDLNAVIHSTVGCTCNSKFYNTTSLSSNGNCIPCHDNCKTCISSLLCTSCLDSNAEIHPTVGCTCKNNYFNETSLTVDGNCMPCHQNCETCTSSFLCTSCKDSNAEIHSTVGCICKSKYYNTTSLNSDGSCKICHSECLTCSQSLICDSCIDQNATPHLNLGCICNAKYYNITSLSIYNSCKKCHIHCESCTTGSQCVSCIASNSIPSSIGCRCKDGFYQISNFSSADACGCIALNSEILNGNCVCKEGFYAVGRLDEVGSCLHCRYGCKKCSSEDLCLECFSLYSKFNQFGGCDCEEGYFDYGLDVQKCIKCPENCLTCVRDEYCSLCKIEFSNPFTTGECRCPNHSILVENKCVCSLGKFISEDSFGLFSCVDCHESCKTCFKESEYDCLECAEPYTRNDFSNQCALCSDGFFLNGTCQQCEQGYKLKNNSCEKKTFKSYSYIEDSYFLWIIFNETLLHDLKASDLTVHVDSDEVSFTLIKADRKIKYGIKPELNQIYKNSLIEVTIINDLLSESYSFLSTKYLKGTINFGGKDFIEHQYLEEAKEQEQLASDGATTGIIVALGISIITNDPSTIFNFINVEELIYSIYLLDLELNPILREFLLGLRVQKSTPNLMKLIISEKSGLELPKKLKKYGFKTNLVLINAGILLSLLAIKITVILILKLLSFIPKIKEKAKSAISWIIKKVLSKFWIQSFFELMVASSVTAKYNINSNNFQLADSSIFFLIIVIGN